MNRDAGSVYMGHKDKFTVFEAIDLGTEIRIRIVRETRRDESKVRIFESRGKILIDAVGIRIVRFIENSDRAFRYILLYVFRRRGTLPGVGETHLIGIPSPYYVVARRRRRQKEQIILLGKLLECQARLRRYTAKLTCMPFSYNEA